MWYLCQLKSKIFELKNRTQKEVAGTRIEKYELQGGLHRYKKSLHSKSLENGSENPEFGQKKWWDLPGLNQRPSDYESPALTTELRSHDSSNITSLSEISRR